MLSRALNINTARYVIIGTAPALLRVVSELERVSNSTASVQLTGESGTGKELFARALHMASPRREKPFIKINCAAIPETLFESELFGYERGAFTGALSARPGWFEQANFGTIFLDEIGELPLAMQSKLLRKLQEGTVIRLGGKAEIGIDVRLVTATNRNLEKAVSAGTFRQDLDYRLNVVPVKLPSLAERRDDIPSLVLHFLNTVNQSQQRSVNLTQSAIDRLKDHDWPGNIRELSNFVERLVLLAEQPILDVSDVARLLPVASVPQSPLGSSGGQSQATAPEASSLLQGVAVVRSYVSGNSHTRQELVEALKSAGGNKSRAAQSLGLTWRQFEYRLKKLAD
jgi:Nif-specific regulatory protein